MKKLFRIFLMAAVAVTLCNCGGGDEPTPNVNPMDSVEVTVGNLLGNWQLTAWSNSSEFPNTFQTVYLQLLNGGNYNLYQVGVNQAGVVLYTGTYSLDGVTLSGRYADGEAWSSDYTVSELYTGMMLLKVVDTEEVSTFTRVEEIPEDVAGHAVAAPLSVRSEGEFRFL